MSRTISYDSIGGYPTLSADGQVLHVLGVLLSGWIVSAQVLAGVFLHRGGNFHRFYILFLARQTNDELGRVIKGVGVLKPEHTLHEYQNVFVFAFRFRKFALRNQCNRK